MSNIKLIQSEKLFSLLPYNVLIIDVRDLYEYRTKHIKGALHANISPIMFKYLFNNNENNFPFISDKFQETFKTNYLKSPVVIYNNLIQPTENVVKFINILTNLGSSVFFLEDGIDAFSLLYPEMIEIHEIIKPIIPPIFIPSTQLISSLYDTTNSSILSHSASSNKFFDDLLPYEVGCLHTLSVPSISEVFPNLYLGNVEGSNDKNQLEKYGITHIVNATIDLPNKFENDGFIYYRVAINDSFNQNISNYFTEVIQFIKNAHAENGIVFVHCFAGISRSATIVLAYLMEEKQMTFNQAFDFLKQKRRIISPNISFLGDLLVLEKKLFPVVNVLN